MGYYGDCIKQLHVKGSLYKRCASLIGQNILYSMDVGRPHVKQPVPI